MAQNLANAEGIVADNNYPKGYKIVDDVTDVNAHINQDIIQFFQKAMRTCGMTPNGLDDNQVNGYQLIEALIKSFKYDKSQVESGLLATETDAGLSEIATNQETIDGTDFAVHLGQNYPLVVAPSKLVNYTDRVKIQTIPIGIWNMDSTDVKSLNHGLTLNETYRILNMSAVINHNESGVNWKYLNDGISPTNTAGQGYIKLSSTTQIDLVRLVGGLFDSVGYGSDENFNRGFVHIMYIPD